jgi:hypothetical protein
VNKPKKTFKQGRARPLADLVGGTLQAVFARQGFAAVDIVSHWEDIVGPELANRTEPMRLVWPRRDDPDSSGTLTVRVEGAYALELQHLAPAVMERVNRYFGWACVGRIGSGQPFRPKVGSRRPFHLRHRRLGRVERPGRLSGSRRRRTAG